MKTELLITVETEGETCRDDEIGGCYFNYSGVCALFLHEPEGTTIALEDAGHEGMTSKRCAECFAAEAAGKLDEEEAPPRECGTCRHDRPETEDSPEACKTCCTGSENKNWEAK